MGGALSSKEQAACKRLHAVSKPREKAFTNAFPPDRADAAIVGGCP